MSNTIMDDIKLHEILEKINENNYRIFSSAFKNILEIINSRMNNIYFLDEERTINLLFFAQRYLEEEYISIEKNKLLLDDIYFFFKKIGKLITNRTIFSFNKGEYLLQKYFSLFSFLVCKNEKYAAMVNYQDYDAISSLFLATTNPVSYKTINSYYKLLYNSIVASKESVKKKLLLNRMFINNIKDIFLHPIMLSTINTYPHDMVVGSFRLLGYYGDLFLYFHKHRYSSRKISYTNTHDHLLTTAIDLQKSYINKIKVLDTTLLKKYFFLYFFKIFYRSYPQGLANILKNPTITPYVNISYDPLPNEYICFNNKPPNNTKVTIKYANLSKKIIQCVCTTLIPSIQLYRDWVSSLLISSTKSVLENHFIYHLGDNKSHFENDKFMYAYDEFYFHSNLKGFYTNKFDGNKIIGKAYSYWENHKENDIETVRHEEIHHENSINFLKVNSMFAMYSPHVNEGLASLFAIGACDNHNYLYKHYPAPDLPILLSNHYASYSFYWIYTNYLMQTYPNFYSDMFNLSKNIFTTKWAYILQNNQHKFYNWLSSARIICKQYGYNQLLFCDTASVKLSDYTNNSYINRNNLLLYSTIIKNDLEKIICLIEKDNFDINTIIYNYTPLTLAIEKNNTEIAVHLIKKGADVNKKDAFNALPLIQAVKKNNPIIVNSLINKKVDVNQKNFHDGLTSIQIAAAQNNWFSAITLIYAGANIYELNKKQKIQLKKYSKINNPIFFNAHYSIFPKKKMLKKRARKLLRNGVRNKNFLQIKKAIKNGAKIENLTANEIGMLYLYALNTSSLHKFQEIFLPNLDPNKDRKRREIMQQAFNEMQFMRNTASPVFPAWIKQGIQYSKYWINSLFSQSIKQLILTTTHVVQKQNNDTPQAAQSQLAMTCINIGFFELLSLAYLKWTGNKYLRVPTTTTETPYKEAYILSKVAMIQEKLDTIVKQSAFKVGLDCTTAKNSLQLPILQKQLTKSLYQNPDIDIKSLIEQHFQNISFSTKKTQALFNHIRKRLLTTFDTSSNTRLEIHQSDKTNFTTAILYFFRGNINTSIEYFPTLRNNKRI